MKKMLMAAGMAAVMTACGTAGQKAATDAGNPFLAEYSTPFGVPPFDLIKVEHYKEAFLKGMEEQKKEIRCYCSISVRFPISIIPSLHSIRVESC